MQRSAGPRESIPNRYIQNTMPVPEAQETTWKRVERLQEPEGQEVCCKDASLRNNREAPLNDTSKIWPSKQDLDDDNTSRHANM